MKKVIRLTEEQLNTYIKKVITEQTYRTSNLQAPEDMNRNPYPRPKSDFGLKIPSAPKFMPDVSSEKNSSTGISPKTPVNTPVKAPSTPHQSVGVLSPDLHRGSKGPEVLKYQQALVKLGHSVGTKGPDSDFGPTTEHSVGLFQSKNGLPKTGRIDKATGDRILSKAHTISIVNKLGDPLQNVKNTPPPLLARPKPAAPKAPPVAAKKPIPGSGFASMHEMFDRVNKVK